MSFFPHHDMEIGKRDTGMDMASRREYGDPEDWNVCEGQGALCWGLGMALLAATYLIAMIFLPWHRALGVPVAIVALGLFCWGCWSDSHRQGAAAVVLSLPLAITGLAAVIA